MKVEQPIPTYTLATLCWPETDDAPAVTCLCCLDEMLSRPSKLVDWAEEWATLKERQSSQSSAILRSIRKCCLAVQRRCCNTSVMGMCTPSIPDPPRPSHLQDARYHRGLPPLDAVTRKLKWGRNGPLAFVSQACIVRTVQGPYEARSTRWKISSLLA